MIQYFMCFFLVIQPTNFAEDVKRWIGEGLHELSVSRPRSRLSWGIPVPEDNSQIASKLCLYFVNFILGLLYIF